MNWHFNRILSSFIGCTYISVICLETRMSWLDSLCFRVFKDADATSSISNSFCVCVRVCIWISFQLDCDECAACKMHGAPISSAVPKRMLLFSLCGSSLALTFIWAIYTFRLKWKKMLSERNDSPNGVRIKHMYSILYVECNPYGISSEWEPCTRDSLY